MQTQRTALQRARTSMPVAAFFLVALGLLAATPSYASDKDAMFGPFGPEGPRMRERFWILPGGNPDAVLRAIVFQPPKAAEPVRRPLVVINHGTDAATREAVSMPVFYWLSRWFVERGYVVALPQRRGHGATGGELAEARDTCFDPDHFQAGRTAADDVEAAVRFMAKQDFVDPERVVVAGVSTGGWASLALVGRRIPGVNAVINFAGGRGAFAGGLANAVCGAERLVAAAGEFAAKAAVPTLWLYARNDHAFGPKLATRMVDAWTAHGGQAELRLLPSYGHDGHAIADDRAGWAFWGPYVEDFLSRNAAPRDEGAQLSAARDDEAKPGLR